MDAFNSAWLASIVSAVIVCIGQALVSVGQRRISEKMDERHEETEQKREKEAEWRKEVDQLLVAQGKALESVAQDRVDWYAWRAEIVASMGSQSKQINAVLKGQTTQMRSDLIHKAHRYLDDLGSASTDEKNAFHEEYRDYCAICAAYGIENSFIDELAKRVMNLPERDI